MKILAIRDHRLPEMLNQEFLRQNYADVNFIISCGDMEASYLEFVSSVLNLPLFYVRGNHDERYEDGSPGGQDLHMSFQTYEGVTMVGLEGSMYYNGKNVQYTEIGMFLKVIQLLPRLLWRRFRVGYGVDYLVTHSPPHGIHDRSDVAHRGFRSFLWLMRLSKARYLIHGHCDIWDRRTQIETQYDQTRVININPKRLLDDQND
jgi:Icc-related predicted phosphoesterase